MTMSAQPETRNSKPGTSLPAASGRYNEPVKWLSLIPYVLCLAAISFAPEASDRQARFLNFSVKQKNGIYVRDLKQEEVKLHLDQEPVEIRYFGYPSRDFTWLQQSRALQSVLLQEAGFGDGGKVLPLG